MKKDKVRISQCMIVKNEEKNIERALSWGKGIVWEQIVVDTGSTDRTVELAHQMGATVYHFQWIDDFAAAKNFAISKAQGEWIAFLDADEYFSSEDAGKLPQYVNLLQNTPYEGILTGWVHLDNEGKVMARESQIRIFKNLPGLRYQRRIHEYLRTGDGRSPNMADGTNELSIYHTGYSREESQKKVRSGRNIRLIQRELEEYPDDYMMQGALGNEYEAMENWEMAELCYRKALALMPEEMKGVYDMSTSGFWYRLLELRAALPGTDEKELLELYEQATSGWPEEADYDYTMGNYYAIHGNYKAGEYHLRRALDLLEKYGMAAKSSFLSGNLMQAYELLAACCFNNDDLMACVQITTMMLKEEPYLMSTLVLMLSAFFKEEKETGNGQTGAPDVAAFLGSNFYQFQSLKDRLFVLQAAIGANYQELVNVIKGLFSPEELEVVNKALGGKLSENHTTKKFVLFYSYVESFNFFTDQLKKELEARNYNVFIMDLREEDSYLDTGFIKFAQSKIDAAVCFDSLAIRTQNFVELWNRLQTVVVDILMDPPLRFHAAFENPPEKYVVCCCDYEHVDYVKQYFGQKVHDVVFMPHVGVSPENNTVSVPYEKRSYDILFCGTYYKSEERFREIIKICPENCDAYKLYEKMFSNLKQDSDLSVWQGFLYTLKELDWIVHDEMLKDMLHTSDCLDWAIRMYQREMVVSTLAESGLNIYLLGRGWENHPSISMPNVHHLNDRIPYGETLAYMANAKINLNVMPGFKKGTHDRIFNTLLQKSVPLTDSSTWIDENFTDGQDIVLYDLKHLEKLPDIARHLLTDTELAEKIIDKGYHKVLNAFTWSHCTDWILETISKINF